MRVDFSKVKVQMNFEGEPQVIDIRKELANRMRQNTNDIGFDELARNIYFSEGEVEVSEEYAKQIIDIVSKFYVVPLQQAIKELLTETTV